MLFFAVLLLTFSAFAQIILGKVVSRPAKLDPRVARKLVAAGEGKDEYLTVLGKTISTDDFYEGQVFLCFGLLI